MTERPDADQRLPTCWPSAPHVRLRAHLDRPGVRAEVLSPAQRNRDRSLLPPRSTSDPPEEATLGVPAARAVDPRGRLRLGPDPGDWSRTRADRVADRGAGLAGGQLLARVPLAELAAIADRLRHKGVPVAYNFVPPMAVVIKSQGGAERPPALAHAARGQGGTGVRVAIVDTGVTRQERTDGWLAGVAREASGADPGNIDELFSDRARSRRTSCSTRRRGHGTAVSGIVQHEAPRTLAVYIPDDPPDGSALESDVAVAMCRRSGRAWRPAQGCSTCRWAPRPPTTSRRSRWSGGRPHRRPGRGGAGAHVLIVPPRQLWHRADRVAGRLLWRRRRGRAGPDGNPRRRGPAAGPWVDCSGDRRRGALGVRRGPRGPLSSTHRRGTASKRLVGLHLRHLVRGAAVAGRSPSWRTRRACGCGTRSEGLAGRRGPGFGPRADRPGAIVPEAVRLRTGR